MKWPRLPWRRKRERLSQRDHAVKATLRTIGPTQADGTFFLPLRLLMQNNELRQVYAQHAWVYAAVNAVARPFAGSPFRVYTGNPDNKTEVQSGPIFDLFQKPNQLLESGQFWEGHIVNLGISGENLWILIGPDGEGVRNPMEVPTEIFPCTRDQLEPILTERGGKKMLPILGWKMTDGSGGKFEAHQVVQFKKYNPYSLLRGLAPIEAAMLSVSGDHKAGSWNDAFFTNGAVPGSIIEYPELVELDPEQIQQLLDSIEERHRGVNNANRPLALDQGAKWKQVSITHEDMAWGELRKFSREDINAVYNVTMFDLGVLEDANRETARQSRLRLYTQNVIPEQRYASKPTSRLIDMWNGPGDFGEFDNSGVEILQKAKLDRLEEARVFQQLGYPINMINERLELEMEPIEGGDVPLVPSGLVPLEQVVAEPDPDPDPGQEPDPGEDRMAPGWEDDLANFLTAAAEEMVDDPLYREMSEELPKGFNKKQREAAWERVLRNVLRPGEQAFRKAARRYYGRLRAAQLDLFDSYIAQRTDTVAAGWTRPDPARSMAAEAVTKVALTDNDIEAILFPLDEWVAELEKAFAPEYQRVARLALDDLREELGGFDEVDKQLTATFIDKLDQLIRQRSQPSVSSIPLTVRKQLRAQLAQGGSLNEPIGDIARRIKKTFNVADKRALTIARTETAGIANGARFLAMIEEGIEFHQWSSSKDQRVRNGPDAWHNSPPNGPDGTVIRLGEHFNNGLLYPGDFHGSAAQIINCRCIALAAQQPPGEDRHATSEAWAKSFNREEKDAWLGWTGKDFDGIRRVSKTGTFDPTRDVPEVVEFHDTILETFKRAPLFRGRVFRGMAPLRSEFDEIVSSKEMTLKALASSTDNEVVARGFAAGVPPGDRVNVFAVFESTETAVDIRAISVGVESEIVLLKGSRYRLVRSTQIDDENWELFFEEII